MIKYKIGVDVGSTTVKLAVLDDSNKLIYSKYERHFSDIKSTIITLINECYEALGDIGCTICITGSGVFLFLSGLILILNRKLYLVQRQLKK